MVNESDARPDHLGYTTYAARELPIPRFGRPQDVKGGVNRPVRSLAWSCDGKWIATGTDLKGLRIWPVRDRMDTTGSFPLPAGGDKTTPHQGHVAALAFSPVDPNILISGCKSAYTGTCVAVWDITAPKTPLASFKIPGDVLHIAFHSSGRQFAVVCPKVRDEVYFYWRITMDGEEVWEKREDIGLGGPLIDIGSEEINSLRFSNSGKLVCAVSNDGSLSAWLYPTGLRVAPTSPLLQTRTNPASEATSPKVEHDQEAPQRGADTPRGGSPAAEEGEGVGISAEAAEEGRAAEADGDGDGEGEGGDVEMADRTITPGEPAPAAEGNGEGGDGEGEGGDVEMADQSKPSIPPPLSLSVAPSRQPTPPPPPVEKSKLELEIGEARRRQLGRWRHQICHSASLLSLSFDPSGRYLALGGQDAMLSLLSTKDWICERTFDACTSAIRHSAFSPDGEMIAMGGDDKYIAIVSVYSGITVATIPIVGLLHSLVWHPTKNWLAYATASKTSVVWYMVHQE